MSHLGDRLSALVDGELDGAELDRAHAHLAGCERCRAEAAELRALKQKLRELMTGAPAEAAMTRRLIAMTGPGGPLPPQRRLLRVVPGRQSGVGPAPSGPALSGPAPVRPSAVRPSAVQVGSVRAGSVSPAWPPVATGPAPPLPGARHRVPGRRPGRGRVHGGRRRRCVARAEDHPAGRDVQRGTRHHHR